MSAGSHGAWQSCPLACHAPGLHAMPPPNLAGELSSSRDARIQLLYELVAEMGDPVNPWGNFAAVCSAKLP